MEKEDLHEPNIIATQLLRELESEAAASRKCLERITPANYEWKPHEKSMKMGYLSLLVAEVPLWIATTLETGNIDFATFKHADMATVDLAVHLDENMARAKAALFKATDADLAGSFHLKSGGQVLMTDTKLNTISSSINHWVHHRGQLTVYMRLNDIPVPSIYGPSADDKTF